MSVRRPSGLRGHSSPTLKPRGILTESQQAKVAVLKSSLSSFAAMRALEMRFRGMLRSGKIDGLDARLRDGAGSGIYGMRGLANLHGTPPFPAAAYLAEVVEMNSCPCRELHRVTIVHPARVRFFPEARRNR
jgi:hypothetical protein